MKYRHASYSAVSLSPNYMGDCSASPDDDNSIVDRPRLPDKPLTRPRAAHPVLSHGGRGKKGGGEKKNEGNKKRRNKKNQIKQPTPHPPSPWSTRKLRWVSGRQADPDEGNRGRTAGAIAGVPLAPAHGAIRLIELNLLRTSKDVYRDGVGRAQSCGGDRR